MISNRQLCAVGFFFAVSCGRCASVVLTRVVIAHVAVSGAEGGTESDAEGNAESDDDTYCHRTISVAAKSPATKFVVAGLLCTAFARIWSCTLRALFVVLMPMGEDHWKHGW